MNKQAKKTFLVNWKTLKQDIDKFIKENNIHEVKATVKKMVNKAQGDINQLVDKDVSVIKKRFQVEKKQVEKLLQKTLQAEVKRAKSFLELQKREITKLQNKLDKISKMAAPKAASRPRKKSTRKSAASTTT
ncbi:MAG: hypothetical protein JNM93_12035 [Bacteriovoracaceae bacterium]|nr:hypothetical protein [Bacteriovoracaceae bacterium]